MKCGRTVIFIYTYYNIILGRPPIRYRKHSINTTEYLDYNSCTKSLQIKISHPVWSQKVKVWQGGVETVYFRIPLKKFVDIPCNLLTGGAQRTFLVFTFPSPFLPPLLPSPWPPTSQELAAEREKRWFREGPGSFKFISPSQVQDMEACYKKKKITACRIFWLWISPKQNTGLAHNRCLINVE